MKIVIIPGLTLPEVTDQQLANIEGAAGDGSEVVVCTPQTAHDEISNTDVVLGFVGKGLFEQAQQLKWVHAIASGVDAFLYPEFISSDVVLTSEKGLVGEHLSDHAFGLLLMLTRQLAAALRYGPDAWNHRPHMRYQEVELTGLTMGIFGFGGTGRATARRAAAFGMNCVALDRDAVPTSAEVDTVLTPSQFEEMLRMSDVVSVCCPLTPETRGKFDAAAFKAMKPGAFLVNVTRGEVMVEDDLVAALQAGEIRGAALDVVPREPLPADSPLWAMENVVMTPHTAGASPYRAGRNVERFINNLGHLRRNETLEGTIDKDAGY